MEEKKQKNSQPRADEKDLEQKVREHQAVLLKYPKNIRQVGEAGDGKRIYVEDYVMTLMMYLAGKTKDGYGSAVLLGKKAVVEGRGTLFISGAIEILQQWKRPEEISSTQWTLIYDQIQKYFEKTEILGWFLTHPGMELKPDEAIHSVWRSSFDGAGEVLLLYDNISREEAFYTCKDGEFIKQPGYYIYYEKNEEMQNYMIEVKGGQSSDEGYRDTTSEKIRQKFEKKQELQKRNLLHQQAAYTAAILTAAVLLAATAGNLRARTDPETLADSTQEVETLSKKSEWVLGEENKTENKTEKSITTTEIEKSGDENKNAAEAGKTEKTDEIKETENETTEQEKKEGTENQKTNNEPIKEETNDEEITTSKEEPDKETQNKSENDQTDFETEAANTQKTETGTEEKNEPKEKTDNEKEENISEETQIQSQTENNQQTEQETSQKNNTSETTNKKKHYEVKKGDTLESISITWYGNSSYVKKIKRINNLENADKIYIGQVLILP